ncbi:hypothetical protein K2P47_00410 [Patescibacteria group bacterium]|nr:hypothetical protein [Patescibacteria group bacterium]
MDTTTLKRELDVNKRNYEIAVQSKRRLSSEVLNTQSKAATYKRDAEAAVKKAEQYKIDYEKVETELKTKTEELRKLDEQISKYTQDISKLEQEFKKLTEEMRRATQSAANDNGAPQQKKSSWL